MPRWFRFSALPLSRVPWRATTNKLFLPHTPSILRPALSALRLRSDSPPFLIVFASAFRFGLDGLLPSMLWVRRMGRRLPLCCGSRRWNGPRAASGDPAQCSAIFRQVIDEQNLDTRIFHFCELSPGLRSDFERARVVGQCRRASLRIGAKARQSRSQCLNPLSSLRA